MSSSDPDTGRASFKPVTITDFVGHDVVRPSWAIEGIWPDRGSGVIAGRPKDGKSTTAAELAITLWSGTPMFNRREFAAVRGGVPVLYIQQENADSRVQFDLQRIMAARGLGKLEEQSVQVETGPTGEPVYDLLSHFDPLLAEQHWATAGIEEPPFHVLSHAGFDLSDAAHRGWLRDYTAEYGFRYVFFDPLYMLVGTTRISDGGDELRPILTWLTQLSNDTECACICTHHMTNNPSASNGPESMLGTTWVHGWYEAAIFTRRSSDGGTFRFKIDALRSHSTMETYTLMGHGVGSWSYWPEAQKQKDALGREAPQKESKAARIAQLKQLQQVHVLDWGHEDYAEALGVDVRTVRRYLDAIKAEQNGGGGA